MPERVLPGGNGRVADDEVDGRTELRGGVGAGPPHGVPGDDVAKDLPAALRRTSVVHPHVGAAQRCAGGVTYRQLAERPVGKRRGRLRHRDGGNTLDVYL